MYMNDLCHRVRLKPQQVRISKHLFYPVCLLYDNNRYISSFAMYVCSLISIKTGYMTCTCSMLRQPPPFLKSRQV